MRAYLKLMGLGAVVAAAWFLASCAESPTDVPLPNQRPALSISAGPIRDSVNVFIATFNWNASDTDGQVTRFYFAIDDTTDWIETETYEITLLFTATSLAGVDSIQIGESQAFIERYRFRGAHTFYLKAVDDDEFFSPISALSFTAQTIAPETQITNPSTAVVVELGPTFTVTWQGIDLDGTENPVGYSYRLVPVANVLTLTSDDIENLLLDPKSPGDPWSPFEPRTSVRLENLEVPSDYIFGVVALDQAGAVEPRIRTLEDIGPTNTLKIRARESGGIPTLCVSSSVKTTCFPTADERRKTFQIPANSNVTFTWSADAQSYGGRIAGYSFGLDLVDPNNFNDPGWAPESANLTRTVIRFDLPPGGQSDDHILYIRAKDDVGTTIIADIILIVVPLTKDRDILYVDDFGPDLSGRAHEDCIPAPPPGETNPGSDFPHDQCQDQFLRESIERGLDRLGHPDWVVDRAEPLDPRNGNLSVRPVEIDSTSFNYWVISGPITLNTLARYKAVVWNVKSESTTQLRAMNQEGNDNFVAVYIESGGAVCFQGTGVYSLNRTDENSVGLAPFGFDPEDLVYRFLKIESVFEGADCQNGCFRVSGNSQALQRIHGFDGAYAHPLAAAEGWPTGSEVWTFPSPPDTQVILRVERQPFISPNKGVPGCETMVVPLGLNINPRLATQGGRLDTLYFYLSNGQIQLFPPANSWMDHGATALRYSGPGQGRVIMLGFPPYFLPSVSDSMMAAGIRWLLAE